MAYPLRAVAAVTALGVVAGVTLWTVLDHNDTPKGPVSLGRTAPVALTTAHDCSTLLKYYKSEADRVIGPYGLNGGPVYATAAMGSESAIVDKAAGAPVPAARSNLAADQSAGSVPDSTTNVQVAGVDEGDVMKVSGDLMVSVVNGTVRITRLAGPQTKTLATWRAKGSTAQSVLLDGTTAVIVADNDGWTSDVRPLGANEDRFGPIRPIDRMGTPRTALTILDLADPAHPRPLRRLEIDGTRSGDVRLVDGELRLAVTSGPSGIIWKQPNFGTRPMTQSQQESAQEKSMAANRKLITKSKIANWIPDARVTALNADGTPDGQTTTRPLIDCQQVAIPNSFSGLETLSMVSVDLRTPAPLSGWKAAGVVAAGSTLYATADRAWLATSRWGAMPVESGTAELPRAKFFPRFAPTSGTTQIHLFETPPRAQPKYVASGEVTGTLLNQFAMDERAGLLRVASTTEATFGGPAEGGVIPPSAAIPRSTVQPDSGGKVGGGTNSNSGTTSSKVVAPNSAAAPDSATVAPDSPVAPENVTPGPMKPSEGRISVLKVDGDQLVRVGLLSGLGRGERIRGVRFDGQVGYVVTYQQTDPLYTVDLTDPEHPRLRGELELPGYSAYLHPAGNGRVLGLGQDGTESGTTTGLQLSLFDVSNLDAPSRLDRQKLAGAWTDAEADHHAFTMTGNLVLIPYSAWTSAGETSKGYFRQEFDAGVIAVRVNGNDIGTPTMLRPIADGKVVVEKSASGISKQAERVMEATPMRTAVHNDTIYTLTASGVAAHSATTLTRETFASW